MDNLEDFLRNPLAHITSTEWLQIGLIALGLISSMFLSAYVAAIGYKRIGRYGGLVCYWSVPLFAITKMFDRQGYPLPYWFLVSALALTLLTLSAIALRSLIATRSRT